MSVRDALERVMSNWQQARTEPLSQHPLAIFIRGHAIEEVAQSLTNRKGLTVKGSSGAGQWAAVPWLAIFDELVTDSATHGYYVVYLFDAAGTAVHLSLNQGTTATRAEFSENTRAVLRDRAGLIRRRLEDFDLRLPVREIDLRSTAQLPADYSAGHAMGQTYAFGALPPNETIVADLNAAVDAYRALTFRGGLDASLEPEQDDPESTPSTSLIELRRYKMHRRIERNRKAAKEAKRHHGLRCQACNLDFEERYGELGKGFIEAHHLRPISSLEEGVAVSYDVAADFAVLCSNCHRMIHRSKDPSDLQSFSTVIRSS